MMMMKLHEKQQPKWTVDDDVVDVDDDYAWSTVEPEKERKTVLRTQKKRERQKEREKERDSEREAVLVDQSPLE